MQLTKTQKRYATQYWLSERTNLENLAAIAKTADRKELIQELTFWHETDGLRKFAEGEAAYAPAKFRCSVPTWLLDGYYAAA